MEVDYLGILSPESAKTHPMMEAGYDPELSRKWALGHKVKKVDLPSKIFLTSY